MSTLSRILVPALSAACYHLHRNALPRRYPTSVKPEPLKKAATLSLSFLSAMTQEKKKAPLRVEQVKPEDYHKIAKIAIVWSRIAFEKFINEQGKSEGIFADSTRVSNDIALSLINPEKEEREVLICKDQENRIQGIAILRILEDQVYLSFLATHPHNIRSSLNPGESQVAGAGTALLQKVVERAKELGKNSIYLYNLPSAKQFYLKAGFQDIGVNGNMKMQKDLFPFLFSFSRSCRMEKWNWD